LAIALDDAGVLEEHGVEMIGAKRQAIKVAEDRMLFKEAMDEAGLQMPRGGFAKSWAEAEAIVKRSPTIPQSFDRRLLSAARRRHSFQSGRIRRNRTLGTSCLADS
jgi:hypothetical protein